MRSCAAAAAVAAAQRGSAGCRVPGGPCQRKKSEPRPRAAWSRRPSMLTARGAGKMDDQGDWPWRSRATQHAVRIVVRAGGKAPEILRQIAIQSLQPPSSAARLYSPRGPNRERPSWRSRLPALRSGRYVSRLTSGTLAVIMAGGRGERLHELTEHRCKPATPFGGKFRIIDFVLSNCVNSGIRQIFVMTQYKGAVPDPARAARLGLPARRVRRIRRRRAGAAADRRRTGIAAPRIASTRTSI